MFSFTECIIIATVCGRSLSHGQKLEVERVYGDVSPDFWQRHQWLDAIVKKRIEILSLRCASAAEVVDPLLLFTYMMAQTTVLYLCKLVKSVTWETDKLNPIVQECEQRSLAAAQEIVSLTHTLKQFNFLKVGSRSFTFFYFIVQASKSDISRSIHSRRYLCTCAQNSCPCTAAWMHHLTPNSRRSRMPSEIFRQ